MAARKKVVEEEVVAEQEAVLEKPKKTRKKKEAVVEVEEKRLPQPTIHDYDTIIAPVITEKTMYQMQMHNQVSLKVRKDANKVEIKKAFEAIFQAHVTAVKIINVISKAKSRGGQHKGRVPGYKKAIVTIKEGEAIDLFRE